MTKYILVCALADAANVVQGSIFTRHCDRCARRVMIAPSGQKKIRDVHDIEVICALCFLKVEGDLTIEPAASSVGELLAEVRATVPNFWRRRQ